MPMLKPIMLIRSQFPWRKKNLPIMGISHNVIYSLCSRELANCAAICGSKQQWRCNVCFIRVSNISQKHQRELQREFGNMLGVSVQLSGLGICTHVPKVLGSNHTIGTLSKVLNPIWGRNSHWPYLVQSCTSLWTIASAKLTKQEYILQTHRYLNRSVNNGNLVWRVTNAPTIKTTDMNLGVSKD